MVLPLSRLPDPAHHREQSRFPGSLDILIPAEPKEKAPSRDSDTETPAGLAGEFLRP